MDIWWFHHGTSGGFTMVFNHSSNRVAQLSLRGFAKITLLLEVRSLKSPKKTPKIPKSLPPKKIHVCVWSPKTPPFPPWSLVISGVWQPGSFFEELYVYFAFLDVKGDRALLRMVLRLGLLRPPEPTRGRSWLVGCGWGEKVGWKML